MKNVFYIILFFLNIILFSSCSQETSVNVYPPYIPYVGYYQPYTTNANNQYMIGGYVIGQTRSANTRAAVSSTYNDSFSLFAWTSDSVVMNKETNHGYHGVFAGNTWGYTEDIKYFDNFVNEYNFLGIIPQSDDYVINNGSVIVNAVTFTEDNATYDNREILYATQTVQKEGYPTGATLTFNHLNSKIFIKFTSDDANTEILDYIPGTPGTPGQDAYDEVIDVTTYSMSATTVPTLGPLVTTIDIDDADMNFVNSKYTSTKGFSNYQSSNTITGNLDENMWEYLVNKYPALSTINIANWSTYASNPNMHLVHIDKTGHTSTDNDSYTAVWVNVQNVNWNAGTTTQQIIHHDAIPAIPATGKPGIIMLPATSALQDGTDAVLATYPSDVNITLSLNDPVWTINSTSNTVTFTKPTGKVSTTPVASPTTWFTFPKNVNTVANLGYTIKFSYKYKDVNVYDARIFIPSTIIQDKSHCIWEAAKYYTYIINITGRGNGHDTPNDPDAIDPKIENTENYQITVNSANIQDYTEGGTWTINIK